MAKSRFEYVKKFELDDSLLPSTWIVCRIDGKGFHKFADAHQFEKPNDERALSLMTRACCSVMSVFEDIVLAYGQSDEYSFLFRRSAGVYNRRSSKILSTVVSSFTSAYVFHWTDYFPATRLQYAPVFDARLVLYPTSQTVVDYFSWRQADCHINNLYNTCFWNLVKQGLSQEDSARRLAGTDSAAKNELLFSQFNTNYNNIASLYRKGSAVHYIRDGCCEITDCLSGFSFGNLIISHTDIIGKEFWQRHASLLE